MKPRVLALVGPTASGKSALALAAAVALRGEIVCMDSMQIYRGLDIGTAKPTVAERAQVPHHLLDVAAPTEAFSVAQYSRLAQAAIAGILARGCLPILCGGTGLYLRALSRPMDFGQTAADEALRAHYQEMAEKEGNLAVHAVLQQKDPDSAARLHPNNLRRVIRALEVLAVTGQPISTQQMPEDDAGPYDLQLYALNWPREQLYQRIDARVDLMLAQGLLAEVRTLVQAGVPAEAQSMQGLGYKELLPVLAGTQDISEAKELLARRTRNYAKRQLTWFKADQRIQWLEGTLDIKEHLHTICKEMGPE